MFLYIHSAINNDQDLKDTNRLEKKKIELNTKKKVVFFFCLFVIMLNINSKTFYRMTFSSKVTQNEV